MAEIKVEVELECKCGNALDVEADRWGTGLIITPCDKCLEGEYEKGKTDGYSEAENDLKED